MKLVHITASLLVVSSVLFAAADGSFCSISRCPTYWTYFEGSCYRLFAVKKTWEEAEEFCKNIGAPNGEGITHLASIHSQDEQDFIYIHWSTHRDHTNPNDQASPYASIWIGLNYVTENNVWEWTDGSDVDKTFWLTNEPSGGGEDAVHMRDGPGHNGRWNDVPHAWRTLPFICKTPAFTCAIE